MTYHRRYKLTEWTPQISLVVRVEVARVKLTAAIKIAPTPRVSKILSTHFSVTHLKALASSQQDRLQLKLLNNLSLTFLRKKNKIGSESYQPLGSNFR